MVIRIRVWLMSQVFLPTVACAMFPAQKKYRSNVWHELEFYNAMCRVLMVPGQRPVPGFGYEAMTSSVWSNPDASTAWFGVANPDLCLLTYFLSIIHHKRLTEDKLGKFYAAHALSHVTRFVYAVK